MAKETTLSESSHLTEHCYIFEILTAQLLRTENGMSTQPPHIILAPSKCIHQQPYSTEA